MANLLEQQKYFHEVVVPAAIAFSKTLEIFTPEEIDVFVKAFEERKDERLGN